MKKTILDTVISIITTSVIYCLLSIISSTFLADKGCVRITGTYKDENFCYKNIELVNYSNNYQNEIYFKIPSSAKIKNESHISTLLIEKENIKAEDINLYKLNQIQPESSTVIVIKLENENDSIQFTNLKEKKFSLETQGRIESPKLKLFKQLLPNALLYIIIFSFSQFLGNYFIAKRQKELDEKIKEKNKKLNEIEQTLEKTDTELKDVKKKFHKAIFLFKKQLSDYSKENEFWRNTVRQLLYTGDRKNKKAEQLFETVTNQLQTYSVKSKRNLDLEEIIFVAEELEEYDRKNSKYDKK